jgi:predicted nucleic acid-binding protein
MNLECLPVSDAVPSVRKMKMKMPDAIILATAESAGRVLVTRNVKDFPSGMAGVRVPYRV